MTEYILLLGTDSYLRERALAGARQATSLPIWNVLQNPVKANNRFYDGCIKANPLDKDELLAGIKQVAQTTGWLPKAVVPVNDWSLRQATFLNRELGLIGLSDEVTANTRSKHLMKQILLDAAVPTAAACLISGPEELELALERIGFPVVIKPVDFGGSGGVSLARNPQEAREALKFAMDMMAEYAGTYQVDASHFLVEAFIESEEEVSVEVLCHGGAYQAIAVTEKYLSPLPYFAEIGHLVPSHRSGNQRLKEIACQACEALGINLGIAHVEIKIKGDQYWVIELAARPGGDAIMDLVEKAYGENMYKRHVMSYMGLAPLFEVLPQARKTAAVSFLKAAVGQIVAIEEDVALPADITSIEITAKPGLVSEASKCWRSREGIVQFEWADIRDSRRTDFIETTQRLSHAIFSIKN